MSDDPEWFQGADDRGEEATKKALDRWNRQVREALDGDDHPDAQEVADALDREDDRVTEADEIADGAIVTVGVSSVCLTSGDDPESLGHCLMLDLDDVEGHEAYSTFGRIANQQGGVTALLQSSPGSYHLWNLGLDELDQQLLRALRTPCEALHVQQSAKRGRFILRAAPKFRTDDDGRPTEKYKDAPEVLQVRADASDRPQSQPHLDLLSQLHSIPIEQAVDLDPVGDLWVGGQVVRSDYLTLDDDTKRRW